MRSATAMPAAREPRDLLGRRVGLALDDRAGVAEAHARHLVHEAAGHEGDDRQRELFSLHPLGELRLHPAARLGVDDDRLRLRVGLEQRHQLRVGRADDRVAADRDAVDWPRPAAVSVFADLGRHAAGARHDADRPGRYACAAFAAGPPMPPILASSGEMMPRQFGPMMRAPLQRRELDHLRAPRARGMRSVTMTSSLMPFSIASKTASRAKARRHGDDRAVDGCVAAR